MKNLIRQSLLPLSKLFRKIKDQTILLLWKLNPKERTNCPYMIHTPRQHTIFKKNEKFKS